MERYFLTLNCAFTLIYRILTMASLLVSYISMLVHWPSRLYKYCDLNCTTNVAKVQIPVATPTGKGEKKQAWMQFMSAVGSLYTLKKILSRERHSTSLWSKVICINSIQKCLKTKKKGFSLKLTISVKWTYKRRCFCMQ